MFLTPDFGHSDLWHLNFALKSLLSSALQSGYFPFWSRQIGTGFPLLAEGQIGMFYWYNLIAYRFFPLVWAFNGGYLTSFALIAIGSWLFGRSLGLGRLSALFLALIFTLSGVTVTQVPHYNLLQAVSLLPWAFFTADRFQRTQKKIWLAVFVLVVSQQFFAVYQQITLITLIGVFVFVLLSSPKHRWRNLLSLSLATITAVILAAPQLLPSWQLIGLSFRSQGTPISEIARFPFNPLQLLQFLHPYLLGDPRIGTYPPYSPSWGIFWETTGYLGLIPPFLALTAYFRPRLLPPPFRQLRKSLLLLSAGSLLLMLGKFTPLFFLFQLPPLSLFRVPARFVLLLTWSLAVSAGLVIEVLYRSRPRLTVFLILLAAGNLLAFALTYNPWVDPTPWLRPPPTAAALRADRSWFRIYPINIYRVWNQIFLTRGWEKMNAYLPLRSSLSANENLLWEYSSLDYDAGLAPRRLELFRELLEEGIIYNERGNSVSIASSSAKLLRLAGVKYLTSPYPLVDQTGQFPLTKQQNNTFGFYLYRVPHSLPHAYLTTSYRAVDSLESLRAALTSPDPAPILEETLPGLLPDKPFTFVPAVVTRDSDLTVAVTTQSTVSALLILSDSYYPGWQATTDGRPSKILPANLNQRAVFVPSGEHRVVFNYRLKIF